MRKNYLKIIVAVLLVVTVVSLTNMQVYAKAAETVYIGGFACGFSLKTKGAEVVGVGEVFCGNSVEAPAKKAGISTGDTLISLGEIQISCSKDIEKALKNYNGGAIIALICRNGEKLIKEVFPVKDSNGIYKLGIFVRDNLNGIGTITFIKQNREFMALGHPVINEQNKLLEITGGALYNCSIIGISKGERGKAGELKGVFVKDEPVGKITENTQQGLKGVMNEDFDFSNTKQYETAKVKQGAASIWTTVCDGAPKEYSCSIVKAEEFSKNNKNFVIKITDEELIEISGGIVQGMSGSPIIQNGKLVGAVTHVFVNDPTRGFGIGIDKMLSA